MLRRFRTWLSDVIRPVDVQPAPAPVVVADEPPVIFISDEQNHISDELPKEAHEVQKIALRILEDRASIRNQGPINKRKRKQAIDKKLIKTDVFAAMLNVDSNKIIEWKNGKSRPPFTMPKCTKVNGQKSALMWDRAEALVCAYIYSKSESFNDEYVETDYLMEFFGTTYNVAYNMASKWSAENYSRSSWTIIDGRRAIKISHAIEIALTKMGLPV